MVLAFFIFSPLEGHFLNRECNNDLVVLKRTVQIREGDPSRCLRALLGLFREEDSLDVGQDTTLSDGDAREEFVQLFVVPDGQLEMTGNDSRLLVVTSGVTGQFQHFGGEVFHHRCKVDWSTGSHPLGVVSLPQEPVDPSDGELKPGTRRPRLCLSLGFTAFAASRHDFSAC